MAKKKKRLPKDFRDLLEAGDLAALTAVFETCELDARDGPGGSTALGLYGCTPELARWLIDQGAEIDADCGYGNRPASRYVSTGNDALVTMLLDAGAAMDTDKETLLQRAASSIKPSTVRLLLDRGADPLATAREGDNALTIALRSCRNAALPQMALVAEYLIDAGTPVTDATRENVQRIGKDFEFHRAGFNPAYLAETDAALQRLYQLFAVDAAPVRRSHNGTDPIVAKPGDWRDQHQELWEWLIPSAGAAETVQGEVIRISGRVHIEQAENGGANWDAGYRKMLSALVDHLGSGEALPPADLDRARDCAEDASDGSGSDEALAGLCELAVQWVATNPAPIILGKPAYAR